MEATKIMKIFTDTAYVRTGGSPEELKAAYMANIPLKRFGEAEDIAKAVAWLAGDDSSYVTGQIISVNGGMVG